MKKIRANKLLLIGFMVIIVALGCKQKTTNTTRQEIVVADTVNFSVFREEINSLIQNSPKQLDIVNFVNEMGSSYIFDLTLPLVEAEKFETQNELSLAWGAYVTDMIYANAYNRYDVVPYLCAIVKQLSEKLGVRDQAPQTVAMLKRMSMNENNSDSLDYYLHRILNISHQELSTSEIPDVYALFFIGASIESCYLLTQLTSYARENQQMISYLSDRRDLVKSIFRLTEILSVDETIKPYYEKMLLINKYFDSHPVFSEKELNEMTILIQNIRHEMFRV
jgi:hypothetical protein